MADPTSAGHARRLCECGCGRQTEIAKLNNRRDGSVAGQPRRFVHGHNGRLPRPGRRTAPHLPDYLEELCELVELFVGAVHDEDPADGLRLYRAALARAAPAGVDPGHAFAVCLAAQINVDATRSDRLGWVAALGGDRLEPKEGAAA